ncbi:MAG TPA: MDR family MFS transporter [Mycobacteriales bacterium]|nr:MDR family MFS transporter [Mycobacteriales bacterium]
MTTTAEPVAPSAPPELDNRTKNIVFATIALGMLMAALDQTIVSTSLPSIVTDLGGGTHISWVVTAYLLAETIATVITGRFGDLFGRKRVFQTSVVIFLAGSALSGAAQNFEWLVAARALQGLGGGGLTVTATALIGDVIPLRDRGRYQGALGGVFGVTTVLGPLLGGYFTDSLSWRWDFYVNLPVGIVVIALAARTLPSIRATERPVIDYAGVATVGVGSAGLILATSWGGTTYPWLSPQIITLFVVSAVALAAFVWVELRAVEPILPMRLFRGQVFTVCCALSFLVGFAMLGSITFLPTFLQYVDGVSATMSGIRMLPLVVGLMFTALLSGVLVSRTGRYKIYPVLGMPIVAVGFFLLSRFDQDTSSLVTSLSMVVVGLGIGLCLQVLTLVVQSTARYRDLGVATSGVTFFRTMGSSFGAAVFGSMYANFLAPRLVSALRQSPDVPPAAAVSPTALHQLPDDAITHVVDAYATSLQMVFRWAIPVALVGFALALVLKEVPLRDTERAAASDLGEKFAMPTQQTSQERLERAISWILRRDPATSLRTVLERSGTTVTDAELWGLAAVFVRARTRGGVTSIADIAIGHRLPPTVIAPFYHQLAGDLLVVIHGEEVSLTPAGQDQVDLFIAALKQWLVEQLSGWETPLDAADVSAALDRIATRFVRDEDARRRELIPA